MNKKCCVLFPKGSQYDYACSSILSSLTNSNFDYRLHEYSTTLEEFEDIIRQEVKSNTIIVLAYSGILNNNQIYQLGFSDALNKKVVLISLEPKQKDEPPAFVRYSILLRFYQRSEQEFIKLLSDILLLISEKREHVVVYTQVMDYCKEIERTSGVKLELVSEKEFLRNITWPDLQNFSKKDRRTKLIFIRKAVKNKNDLQKAFSILINSSTVLGQNDLTKEKPPVKENESLLTRIKALFSSEKPKDKPPVLASVLIVTVTKTEALAVLETFSQASAKKSARRVIGDRTYYDLGVHGGAPVFMVQSEMGIATPGGALLTVSRAVRDLRPQAVIMCGIAFGLQPEKQRLGDIVIAKQIQYYEFRKMDAQQGQIARGDRTTASERLLNRFRSADNHWQGAKTWFGLVLSGEKLVNDPVLKSSLLKEEPEAAGGEMEGAGLYAAARDAGVDWILVKAICDWADGSKNDDAQPLAARNAAQFVLHVLQLGGWERSGQIMNCEL